MAAKKVKLENTVELMLSDDYKERLRGEYWQLRDRTDKLRIMVRDYAAGKLDFEPTCPIEVLSAQLASMTSYLTILEGRARLEKVKL